MIHLDYKMNQITKDGKDNLTKIISSMLKVDLEIVIEYINIYNEYPYIVFDDNCNLDFDMIKHRLNNISRKFKIKKLKQNLK